MSEYVAVYVAVINVGCSTLNGIITRNEENKEPHNNNTNNKVNNNNHHYHCFNDAEEAKISLSKLRAS
jgi:hypothetical protein